MRREKVRTLDPLEKAGGTFTKKKGKEGLV